MPFDPSKYMDAQGNPTDPGLVHLAMAIRSTESHGHADATGASGEKGAYQWMPGNFKSAAKQFGVDPADFSLPNQNKVAYLQLAQMKDKGLQPYQIASSWNSGSPDNWQNHSGVNSQGVAYDTPAYVKRVMDTFTSARAGKTPVATVAPLSTDVADQAAGQQSGAWFPSSSNDNPAIAALKTAGNVIPSAYSFGKGVVSSMNPVKIASDISQIPGQFGALTQESGGVGNALSNLGSELLPTAYKQLVPAFGRDLIAGDVASAQRDVTNNPVGSIAPFIFAGKGAAEGIDALTKGTAEEGAGASSGGTDLNGAFESGMSKIASPVTGPARAFGNALAENIPKVGRYAFGQATGLDPQTIALREANPDVDISTLSRASAGETINSALQDRLDHLTETGKSYAGIRASTEPIDLQPNGLSKIISDNTGLNFKGGTWEADTTSAIRNEADVAKIQKLYDFWQPKFMNGEMTSAEFLNLRTDLADMAKYDTGYGKSAPLDRAGQGMRSDLNTTYREKIAGLEEKDADFSSQKTEFDNLRKGLLDKNNNLTDAAINKIANAAGKGKDQLIARLEEISPGITKQIQLVKMAEDFERAGSTKVGTYTRSTLGAGGLVAGAITGNIPIIAASLAEIVLQSPAVADTIIKTYGASKPLMLAIGRHIRQAGSAVNNLPNAKGPLTTSVFGRPSLPAAK